MNKEIEDALHTLLHCSLKDTEYETQFEQYKIVRNYITNLQQKNKQLKEDLRVSQSNEETYELEMQEITKILGLDEHTLFDDVKDYAKQLKEEIEEYKRIEQKDLEAFNNYDSILTELEEYIGQEWYCFDNESIEFEVAKDILNKIQELKEKYK